ITPGPPGMETLVLLARATPLSREVDLQKLLAGLPPQKLQQSAAAVWFENGHVLGNEKDRAPNFFDVQQIDDPVLQTQRLLNEKLQPNGSYSCAVSFANQGK